MTEKEKLLKQYLAYQFAAHEWNLYLDTHPDDVLGIAIFKQMRDKANVLREEYQEKYGPLTACATTNSEYWEWIDMPWPWDKN